MGHQHYSTTIDIYTHVMEEKYREEIGKFGRAIEKEELDEMKEDVGQGVRMILG